MSDARAGSAARISFPVQLDPVLVLGLAALAVLAFLARFLPVFLSIGLHGIMGYDDGVYMGTALALVRGRIVYRDFYMLHPPGIAYVLSPFALLSLIVPDATAFSAARVGFMLLGAVNTVLVGLVARHLGRLAAIASALVYAIWIVPVRIERTTWLTGPQNTLLLLALLLLATAPSDGGSARITWRRAALIGALVGFCGATQIWALVPAFVVFVWIGWTMRRWAGDAARALVAYALAGVVTVVVMLAPFFLAAGPVKVLRIIIFDQVGRFRIPMPLESRIATIEGMPTGLVREGVLGILPVLLAAALGLAILLVAWRRPGTRLWVALLIVQSAFLLTTPYFSQHYSGWIAPVAALCVGSLVGVAAGWIRAVSQSMIAWTAAAAGAIFLLACVAGLLLVTLLPGLVRELPPGRRFDASKVAALLKDARCPTADAPTVLIETGALRRMTDNGCWLLVSPTGVSFDTDRDLKGRARVRENQPEYQRIMLEYYGSSDAAMFSGHLSSDGFTDATWQAIKRRLPVEERRQGIIVLLPKTNQ